MSECTYGAVEYHEALVEVVMLHGGVAVELGQWVVAPGHTQEEAHRVDALCCHTYIYLYDSYSPSVPLYVGVVDSSVVQIVAESCNHQSQDL